MSNTSSPCSCTKRFSPSSTLRIPIWRTQEGLIAGAAPPMPVSAARSEPAQAGDRHAVHVAARGQFAGIEVRVRIQPQHPQFLALLAAVARHRADGTDAQTVIAAQEDRQPSLAQLCVDAPRAPVRSSAPPRADGGSRPPAAARDCPGRSGSRGRAPQLARRAAPRPGRRRAGPPVPWRRRDRPRRRRWARR